MTIPYRTVFPLARAARIAAGAILAAVLFSFTAADIRAQQTPYYDLNTPEVSVDLSVLNDGGIGAPRTGAVSPSVGGGTLLMPGGHPPQSRLLVAPPRKPSPAPRMRSTAKRKPVKKARARTKPKPRKKARARPQPPKVAAAVDKGASESAAAAKTKSSAAPPPPPALSPSPETPSTEAKAPPPPPPAMKPTALGSAKPSEAKPEPAPAKQQAAVPPAASAPPAQPKHDDRSVQVVFSASSAKVPTAAKSKLKTLAAKLKGKESLRLQLKAYAGGTGVSPSKARRLSLSRALAVRSYMISTGVRSTRIDVRALGDKTTEQPINRVDVSIVER